MEESTVNPVPLANPDIEMKESTVHPVPHLDHQSEGPDTEDEYLGVIEGYLVPTDDVEMDSHESSTLRAFDTQVPRNDNDSTSRPKSIMPATQQNTAASAENAVRFHPNSDSPVFNVRKKRPMEGDEEHREKNERRIHFVNPTPSKLRQANQSLNKNLQVQQALLTNQSLTIQRAEQTIFHFKKTAEEMAQDRMELLKIIERSKKDQEAQEAEMRRLAVQKERELAAMHRKTRHDNAMATEPSTQATHVAAITMDTQPLAMQFTRPTYTASSSSAADAQPKHQPNSRRTNWKKLKEKASKDQSKGRKVLIATTTTTEEYGSDSSDSDEDKGSKSEDEDGDEAEDEDEANDIVHISKKELRDMVLAAAKTALSMSKRTTRKVQRGNEAKTKKRTALRKEKDMDKGWERRLFCKYVRDLFETVFDVAHDDDFTLHEPPTHEKIHRFKRGEGEGPNPDDLHIDMKGSISSEWNNAVVDILLEKLLEKKADPEYWGDMPGKSDMYFEDLILQKLTRARSSWRNAQPHLNEEGELESIDEVEKRMITTKEERDRAGRVYTRRMTRYARRKNILDKVIELKESEQASDTPIWKWLRQLIKTLGEDGTSSDESEVDEQTGFTIYSVHKMPWRRNIDFEISTIDKLRFNDKELFSNRGSKPSPRTRSIRNQNSSRMPPKGLPKAVYNSDWIANRQDKRKLGISKKPFEWMSLKE